jgi:hypothetical protein
MVEGSKFRESPCIENTKLESKGEEMTRPLVVFCQSLAHMTRSRHVSYVTFAADRVVMPAVTKCKVRNAKC